MSLNKFTNITALDKQQKGVVALADKPNEKSAYGQGSLTATNLKLWFDKLAKYIADKVNIIQDALSGSDSLSRSALSFIDCGTKDGFLGGLLSSATENATGFHYTLDDLVESFKSGDFAKLILAKASVSATELSSLQSIINSFAEAISTIIENAETEATTRADAVSAEASLRQSADSMLQQDINLETSSRQSADSLLQRGINREASWRQDADSMLQENINSEATARQSADTTLQGSITAETTARTSADTNLQNQIDTLKSTQNCVDVVATKSALDSYTTTNLGTHDKIQVIADETKANATTIYNWTGTAWEYVGAYGGDGYTKTQADTRFSTKVEAEALEEIIPKAKVGSINYKIKIIMSDGKPQLVLDVIGG